MVKALIFGGHRHPVERIPHVDVPLDIVRYVWWQNICIIKAINIIFRSGFCYMPQLRCDFEPSGPRHWGLFFEGKIKGITEKRENMMPVVPGILRICPCLTDLFQ